MRYSDTMIDVRFATALQIILNLAAGEANGIRGTSSGLAKSLGANPSFVRKLLIPMNRDGIVASSLGKKGGVWLGRSPDQITLRDIYRSVTGDKKLLTGRRDVPEICVVSSNIGEFFGSLTEEIELGVLRVLGNRTIAESLAQLQKLEDRKLIERRFRSETDSVLGSGA